MASDPPLPPPPTLTVEPTALPSDPTVLPSSVLNAAHPPAGLLHLRVPIALGVLTVLVAAVWVFRVVRRRGRPRPRWWVARTLAAATSLLLLAVLTTAAGVNVYAGYLPSLSSARQLLFGGTPDGLKPAPEAATQGPAGLPPAAPAPGPAEFPPATVVSGPVELPPAAVTPDPGVLAGGGRAAGTTRGGRSGSTGTPGRPGSDPGGDRSGWRLVTLHLPDPGLRIEGRVVLVALPPGYGQGSSPLPVDYLLSGYPGRPEDWFVSGHVTQVLDQLVANRLSGYAVLVAPDVNGGEFTDSETLDAVGGAQVETWLTRDVVSAVEARWPVLGDRGHRVLAGISSGGFAALNVGLRHQDEFGTLLALEPYGDPGNVTGRLLGGSTDLLHANSPSYYLPRLPLHRLLHVFLDVGGEGDTARVQDLGRLLSARAEDGVLRVEQGQGHTWFEAAAGLPYALANAARWAGDPVLGQILPESAFPLTHRDRYSLLLTQDAGSADQQRACRRLTGGARTRRLPPWASIRSRDAHRPPSPPDPTGAPPAPAAAPSTLPQPTCPVVAAQ